MIKKILLISLFLSIACLSSHTEEWINVGSYRYRVISLDSVRKFTDSVDAIIVWDQSKEKAAIRTMHSGVMKEGTLYIYGMRKALDGLNPKRASVILILKKEYINLKITTGILDTLNPRKYRVYIAYINDGLPENVTPVPSE
jgi:hypothetical protein